MFYNKTSIQNLRIILIVLSITLILNLLLLPVRVLSKQAVDDISDYEYIIDNMRYCTGDLEKYIFKMEDFTGVDSIKVDITRRIQAGDEDLLILAYYSDAKKFIGMSELLINVEFGQQISIKCPIDIMDNESLSEIKVFIWDDLDNITPLSNVLTSKNNIFINPAIEEPMYAVIDDFEYDEEYDSYIITVLGEHGLTKRYFFVENKTKIYAPGGRRITNPSISIDLLKNYVYSDYDNKVKNNITDRVVRYYFRDNTAEMLKVYFLEPTASTNDGTTYMKKYDAYNNVIGPVTINKNYTKILNFEKYLENGSFCPVSCYWLTHETQYEAYGYDDIIEGAYPFVIIIGSDN